jgi:hypothetical protein
MLARCKTKCSRWLKGVLRGLSKRVVDSLVSGRIARFLADQPQVGVGPAEDPAVGTVKRRVIDSGKVTVCKHCGTKHPMWANGTICFSAFFYIYERDLLQMAKEQPGWRLLANRLGFKDAKIDAPWTFPDEGRLIPYQRIKDGEFLSK